MDLLSNFHVVGAPTYVLDTKLQNSDVNIPNYGIHEVVGRNLWDLDTYIQPRLH